jgi:hypothetical protein
LPISSLVSVETRARDTLSFSSMWSEVHRRGHLQGCDPQTGAQSAATRFEVGFACSRHQRVPVPIGVFRSDRSGPSWDFYEGVAPVSFGPLARSEIPHQNCLAQGPICNLQNLPWKCQKNVVCPSLGSTCYACNRASRWSLRARMQWTIHGECD